MANGDYKRHLYNFFDINTFELLKMLRYLRHVNKSVTKREYPKNYFRVNITIMKLSLIWFPERRENILALSYSIIWVILASIMLPLTECMFFKYAFGDLNIFINHVGVSFTHAIGGIKVLIWCFQHKRILVLMEALRSDEFQYESYGDFEPGLIVQKAKQKNIVFSTMFFWSCNMVLIMGYIEPIYSLIFQPDALNTLNIRGDKEFCWKLPFFIWMPFNHSTYWTCVLAHGIQFFLIMYLTCMIVAVDTLLMGIMNYITAHLDIVQSAFKTIRPRAFAMLGKVNGQEEMLHDDEELNAEMRKQMAKATKYLQTVYSLCKTMEEIYSIQILLQVFDTLVVMCTCMYLLSTETIGSKLFLVELVYIIAVQYQLSLYCWFGNEMTLAHSRIPLAIYECDWFSTSELFKKSLLITMIRTQRDLVLTVGKFSPLTLNTLVTIMRGSYSLLAVLKKNNSPEN